MDSGARTGAVFEYGISDVDIDTKVQDESATKYFVGGNSLFWVAKRSFDILGGLALFPLFIVTAASLLILNIFWNRGPLFFVQTRMGEDCKPFDAIKFRSMTVAKTVERGPEESIEKHRITRLGKTLRKLRLDELPQILNVLRGQMSLIGPRPDYYSHATYFIDSIPGYRERHMVRPGISGLAQVSLGYAEGTEATCKKVIADHDYIRGAGFVQETALVWRTIITVVSRAGA